MPDLSLTPDPDGWSVETASYVVSYVRDGDRLHIELGGDQVDRDEWENTTASGVGACLATLPEALALLRDARDGKAVQRG